MLRSFSPDQPSGHDSVVTREDGSKQWAYKGKPVHACKPDAKAGDPSAPHPAHGHLPCCQAAHVLPSLDVPEAAHALVAWPRERMVRVAWRPEIVAAPRAPPGIRASARAPPVA